MEKNLKYFKEREAEIVKSRSIFKAIDNYWELYEKDFDSVNYKDYIKALGSVSALKVWDALTREQQDDLLKFYKDSLSKDDIVREAMRINDEELNMLHREYSDWHFEKFGWVSYSF